MKRRRGQATMEFILAYSALLLPLTMMVIFTAKMLWVWHSVVDFTREGARYATTHCWQGNGDNVRTWMRQNAPLTFDRDQLVQGPAEIQVTYYARNPESGDLEDFSCDAECSVSCVPDVVRVTIAQYEFRSFMSYLGLPPIAIPNFQTTLPMEGAGCNPDTGECLP